MTVLKLSSTNAFVVFDIDGAPGTGVVRAAPKILQGGAEDMARSMTYTYAMFGMRRAGASAGINAGDDDRAGAVAAFVEELLPMVGDGRLCLDQAKGIPGGALDPLLAADTRSAVADAMVGGDRTLAGHLAALGPVVAAETAIGGLAGCTVAIEGFGDTGPAIASMVADAGATVVAVSTSAGSLASPDGLDASMLASRWIADGDALVGEDAPAAWRVFTAGADVLFTGSKMGAIGHETAAKLTPRAVVPHAPLPYTARALAVLTRNGSVVLPDFVATAAPIFAWHAPDLATADEVVSTAREAIADAVTESMAHDEGLFVGACRRAEAFLSTWQDTLPFGRPLAS